MNYIEYNFAIFPEKESKIISAKAQRDATPLHESKMKLKLAEMLKDDRASSRAYKYGNKSRQSANRTSLLRDYLGYKLPDKTNARHEKYDWKDKQATRKESRSNRRAGNAMSIINRLMDRGDKKLEHGHEVGKRQQVLDHLTGIRQDVLNRKSKDRSVLETLAQNSGTKAGAKALNTYLKSKNKSSKQIRKDIKGLVKLKVAKDVLKSWGKNKKK